MTTQDKEAVESFEAMKQTTKGENKMKKTTLYFVWEDDANIEIDGGYWCPFQSLEDAVSQGGDGVEVFKAELERIGRFRRKAEIVKIKARKKRKAK